MDLSGFKKNKAFSFNIIFIIAAVIIVVFAGNCTVSPSTMTQDGHIIVASILPIVEFASKVGGEKIDVFEMIPPGASPHTYEPTPGQLEKVSKAGMYLAVGSGIEFEIVWLDKIIAINDDMMLVDCSKGIELIEISQNPETKNGDDKGRAGGQEISGGLEDDHEGSGKDPHIWLSPKNAAVMVENIYLGLSAMDPDNEDYFYDNKVDFLDELEMLDRKITEILLEKTRRKILVFHPSWAYFARDYGLEQTVVEEDGKEPSPKGMANLIDQAKESGIKVVFASPEFSQKSAEVIAGEIGGEVVLISPLARDYVKNLINIAEAFKESMD
ncbi:MAG: zinc ABC transporter substrate-binding protein [Actinomycetia bacterium]|nr:zinc ABC transporter substrate-binding protein [Actinomycetes bacterium]